MKNRIFTSESVTEGHPDKVCDSIADRVLDALLEQDKDSRVAVEVCATTNLVVVMGEVSSKGAVDIEDIVIQTVSDIGYDGVDNGFDAKSLKVLCVMDKQSEDIALGVDNSLENKCGGDENDLNGAGDQGMVFGYAARENEALMPMPIYLAHKLTARLTETRKNGELPYLRPDGKAQVTVEYDGDKPLRVDTVVLSTQHDDMVDIEKLRQDIKQKVISVAVDKQLLDDNTKYFINPTGRFVIGGPHGDTGVTGRKIIVDSYGGYCPHGGGAFSGKDATKVDRSACYMARYICKNIVASGIADKCQMDIAYAIGVARPVSVQINTFGTAKVDEDVIANAVFEVFDLRPSAIIKQLSLKTPLFAKTTNYGHFGKANLPWEQCDKVEAILEAVQKLSK